MWIAQTEGDNSVMMYLMQVHYHQLEKKRKHWNMVVVDAYVRYPHFHTYIHTHILNIDKCVSVYVTFCVCVWESMLETSESIICCCLYNVTFRDVWWWCHCALKKMTRRVVWGCAFIYYYISIYNNNKIYYACALLFDTGLMYYASAWWLHVW